MSTEFPFIVIEGLSGSGKTTISLLLSKKYKGVYIKPPEKPFSGIRSKVDKSCDDQTRFLFYLSALSHTSHIIKRTRLLKSVFLDKYIYTTLFFPKSKGINTNTSSIKLEKPTITFYLRVKENTRLKRIQMRDFDTFKQRKKELLRRERLIDSYFINQKNIHLIDNNKTIEETVAQIDVILKSKKIY